MKKTIYLLATVSMLIIPSCTKNTDFIGDSRGRTSGGSGSSGGNSNVTMVETNDWKISVTPRQTVNGEVVDIVNVSTTSSSTYYVDAVPVDYFSTYYNNDVKSLFNDLISGYTNLSEYLSQGSTSINFSRMDSGEWIAFAVGMDSNGNFTGYYSSQRFTLTQDEATEAYNSWIGKWKVNDEQKSYTLRIAAYENNYKYAVSGWESDNQYAGSYSFITEYSQKDGSMTFFAQLIDTYTTTDSDVYAYFVGSGYSGNTLYIWDYEGADIAIASKADTTATVKGCTVSDDSGTSIDMTTMGFADYFVSSSTWFYYTNHTPAFPFTMTKQSTDASTDRSAVRRIPMSRMGTIKTKSMSGNSARRASGSSAKSVKSAR